MYRVALIALCFLLLSGCASRYVYPDPEVPKGEAAGSALSGLVLGVERDPRGRAPYDLQTVVDALNEYQVFKRTAYVDQLDVPADLVLRNYRSDRPGFRGQHGEAGGFLCVAYINAITVLATLTVVPTYCNVEDEASFTLEVGKNPAARNDFHITRHSKDLMGVWAPVVANLNPDWVSATGVAGRARAEAELIRRYKKYVVQQLRALEPQIVRLSTVTTSAAP